MTSPLSRMGFNHPAQGAAGDATLYSNIEAIYQAIGDDMPFRWFLSLSITNGATVTLTHSLRCAFAQMQFRFYSYTGTFTPQTTELTRLTQGASGISVIANVTNPTTQVDVTNNTGGTINLATLLSHIRYAEQLSDLSDVNPANAQDGQALVYDVATGKFLPGASGDASFKLQGITSDVVTLKGGHIMLGDGRELATFDGTNYGVDMTANLLTLLATPGNGTTYYLYIDLDSLGAAVSDESVGRSIYGITVSNLVLATTLPVNQNRARYVPIGLVVGIAANHYSTTLFKTLAVRVGQNNPNAVSPIVYRLGKTLISSPGNSGQIAAGHVLSTKSWPTGMTQASQLAYFNLAANANDNGPQGLNLTNNGTTPFTGANIFATASAAANLNGTTQYFSSTNAFFNPGNGKSWAIGGWFAPTSWTAAATLIAQSASTADRGLNINVQSGGDLQFQATNTAGSYDATITLPNPGLTAGSFHHLAMVYNFSTTTLSAYLDGKLVGTVTLANTRTVTSPLFGVGAQFTTPTGFTAGRIEDAFFVSNYLMSDTDIQKVYSYRLDHAANVLTKNQMWSGNAYTDTDLCKPLTLKDVVLDVTDSNSTFFDFSQFTGSLDSIELALKDSGLSPTVVTPVPPYDVTYTGTPGSPVAHGQPDIPKVTLLVETGTVGQWEEVATEGKILADATNLTIDLSTLSPAVGASPNRARIIAQSSRQAAVGVPQAQTNRLGSIYLNWGGYSIIVGTNGQYSTVTAALASAAAGDSILVVSNTTETGNLTVPAGVKVDQLPNTTVTISGTFGVILNGAKAKWRNMNVQLNPAGTLAIGISVVAADCWVDGSVELNTAQTVTDMVNESSAGLRPYVQLGIKKTAGVITNLETNNSGGPGNTNVWGG